MLLSVFFGFEPKKKIFEMRIINVKIIAKKIKIKKIKIILKFLILPIYIDNHFPLTPGQ